MSEYDAIVIGAGNAGLTAATTLQRGGARTLLVERHNLPGGCATSFVRGRFEFEVALHQLSGIGHEGQPFSLRNTFDQLGVSDRIEFVEEKELYRTVIPGVLDVTLPADWPGAVEAIEVAFPGNRDRVERFFELCREAAMWQFVARRANGDGAMAEQLKGSGASLLRHGLRSVQEVLDEHFDDPGVKYVLASYWGYLGQSPSRLPFMDLALLLFAYFEYKPWHIIGGSQAMSTAILNSFHEAGGDSRFNVEVTRIITREGAAAGVRLDDGEEISADVVVSNVSSLTTFGSMLDPEMRPDAVGRDFSSRRLGVSGFVLHMGLDATPDELGLNASTNLISRGFDVDRQVEGMHDLRPAEMAVASCYDVEPIGFSPRGGSHVSLMTLQYADAWHGIAPEDYAATKFRYAESLLDLMAEISPNVREVIEEVDVATPLTMERYLGHPGGAIYGFDQDATESWVFRDGDREPQIPGLHLTGSWVDMGGFQPTLQGGVTTGKRILSANAN